MSCSAHLLTGSRPTQHEADSAFGAESSCGTIRIDALVYELYGLTEEEIAIVEEVSGQ